MTPKNRARNAYAAPAWAAESRVGDVGTKATLLVLANYADENASCYPGHELIAEETEQSVSTIYRQLRRLKSLGLIRTEKRYDARGKRTSDRYFLHLDVVVDAGPEEGFTTGQPDRKTESDYPGDTGTASDSTTGHLVTVSTTGHVLTDSPEATTGHPVQLLPVTGDRVTPRGTPRNPNPLLTLVSRLSSGNTRATTTDIEVDQWQAVAGEGVDLDVEARAWLAFNQHRWKDITNPGAAWLGWLRKVSTRPGAFIPGVHPSATAPAGCADCLDGWLSDDTDTGRPRPCPTCRPHLVRPLAAVPDAQEASR